MSDPVARSRHRSAIATLYRARPRSRLVRLSMVAIVLLVGYSWLSGDIQLSDVWNERRAKNLQRFLTVDARPYPFRGKEATAHELGAWAWQVVAGTAPNGAAARGLRGGAATLGISVLAIGLAGLVALAAVPFAARNVAAAIPFEASRAEPSTWSTIWKAICGSTRAFLILLRSIPEYVWAFLLLACLGPNAWPAVLALAIHNAGILGKLGAETVENLNQQPLAAWRRFGASRRQTMVGAAYPAFLSRFLLYFFYRFETCVREATVLGMLGVVSLGYWIEDARTKQFYDEMIVFVIFGAGIVLLADLVSALARWLVRRAS